MSDERLPAQDEPRADAPASSTDHEAAQPHAEPKPPAKAKTLDLPPEFGGPKGPEPVRYGDWEKNGRCIDF